MYLLKNLKQFGLNPSDWTLQLQNSTHQGAWLSVLTHKDPEFPWRLTGKCLAHVEANSKVALKWLDLTLL